ncbi:MAG TPA: hypothetical protein VM261_05535 [Kofleriaceae bacterium]|nr:hypothetical protein [Kofleriaceae bacterium]
MKTFLAIFTATPAKLDAWNRLEPSVRADRDKRALVAWNQWATEHAAAIVDVGSPLGHTKRVSAAGTIDTATTSAGYVLIRAESHDAAARIFADHPHFTLMPGDAVEVIECLPLPSAG